MPRSAIRASSMSSRSSRWLPPMISPIHGASTSIAATVRPSSFTHLEGFDGLRVVHHDDGLLRALFGQIALVLRLGGRAEPREPVHSGVFSGSGEQSSRSYSSNTLSATA